MPRILTLSLNPTIDVSSEAEVVRPTHKTRTEHEVFEPGGGGINVARVVRELGVEVEAVCLAGGASGVLLDAGGKGFNVSRGLHALGMATTAMGFVGGPTGNLLENMLHALGIATDFVHCAGETRTNVVVTQPDGTHVKVNEPGPAISAPELQNFYRLAEARARGYARVSLETGGHEPFLPARRLYEAHGFVECPPFADYVLDEFSLCMTREL